MRESNDIQKVAGFIKSRSENNVDEIKLSDIVFIINRFFFYLVRMILNGYVCAVFKGKVRYISFSMSSAPLRKLNNNEKKIFFPSSRIVSSMLYVKVARNGTKQMIFYPGDELQVGMIRIANSDLSYKYIK